MMAFLSSSLFIFSGFKRANRSVIAVQRAVKDKDELIKVANKIAAEHNKLREIYNEALSLEAGCHLLQTKVIEELLPSLSDARSMVMGIVMDITKSNQFIKIRTCAGCGFTFQAYSGQDTRCLTCKRNKGNK